MRQQIISRSSHQFLPSHMVRDYYVVEFATKTAKTLTIGQNHHLPSTMA